MTVKQQTYALVIEPHRVAFFQRTLSDWQTSSLSGEQGWLSTEAGMGDPLFRRLQALNGRINSVHQLSRCAIWVLCAEAAYPQLTELARHLDEMLCRQWQLLQLEPLLLNAAAILPGERDDIQWLQEVLLPQAALRLQDVLGNIEETVEPARVQKEQDLNRLRQEILQLQLEKSELKASLTVAMQPESEQLLSFLPVIFENFWSSLSPADVALLCGQLTIPEIPSPYPEPAADTVHTMKRRFLALPLAEREKIVRWCQSLSHPLRVRNAFRDLLQ